MLVISYNFESSGAIEICIVNCRFSFVPLSVITSHLRVAIVVIQYHEKTGLNELNQRLINAEKKVIDALKFEPFQ